MSEAAELFAIASDALEAGNHERVEEVLDELADGRNRREAIEALLYAYAGERVVMVVRNVLAQRGIRPALAELATSLGLGVTWTGRASLHVGEGFIRLDPTGRPSNIVGHDRAFLHHGVRRDVKAQLCHELPHMFSPPD